MRYTFFNERIKAVADTAGGELISLVCDGKERLWQNPTGEWAGHAPVLFPVCGNCEMLLGGKSYPLRKHGFALRSEFEQTSVGKDHAAFTLRSNGQTLAQYPFCFEFTVRYELFENSLKIVYGVENTGECDMYFSCGGHESFAVEQGIGGYEIVLDTCEPLATLVHDGEGKLTGEHIPLSENGRLPLKREYFKGGNTLIFGNIKSRSAALCAANGDVLARTQFPDFCNLLLWQPEGTNMLCIEPWLNLPDTAGERKEFPRKSGVIRLEPKKSTALVRTVTYF